MRVSVVMPTYNCGPYIEESIQSVIAQTFSDWEIRIVDDCSTDNTYQVIEPYLVQYPNIHYYKLPQNSGPAVARTEAILHAEGKYIAFLDSDDLWMPDKLEKQIRFMETTGAKFSCTAYSQMDEGGNPLGVICVPPEKTNYNKMFYRSDPIGNLTVMYDQEALGKYEVPMIRKRNDYALWLKMLHDVDYCYGMPDVLARYRVRAGSVSGNKMKLIRYQWHLYREIEKMSVAKSGLGILCWAFVKGTGIGLDRRKG